MCMRRDQRPVCGGDVWRRSATCTPPRAGIAAVVDKAATHTISLDALAHQFTTVNTNLVECDWE